MGAGTIDLAMFADGSPFRTAVLPVGGNNVTNDVAIGLKTSLQVAEELKIEHGTCSLASVGEDEEISVSVLGEEAGRTIQRLEVCQIIEARMRETFEFVRGEMARAGSGMLPAGIVLTGGAAQLAGTAELARDVLQMPVRVAAPAGIGGLVDTLLNPSYSTAVGLLQWGAGSLAAGEPLRYESAPAMGGLGRIRDALRSDLPVVPMAVARARPPTCGRRTATRPLSVPIRTTDEDNRASVRTGTEPSLTDLTPACARFVEGEGDGLLERVRAARDGRARDRRARCRVRRRPARRARPAAAARRSLGPPARLARPRRRSRRAAACLGLRSRFRSSTVGWPSARGSRSRSSTRTATTRRGRSD